MNFVENDSTAAKDGMEGKDNFASGEEDDARKAGGRRMEGL